jgi:hypothetical protein|tara:strand:- start:217 stop:507 length:291 start_codon:yes stop_codon:yes gene_type:complete
MEYKTVEEAKNLNGLRLALTAGVPGPWSEAAKALFRIKGIDYIPVFSSFSKVRSVTATFAPSFASAKAMPCRTPCPAPVTSAVLPSSLLIEHLYTF